MLPLSLKGVTESIFIAALQSLNGSAGLDTLDRKLNI